MDARFDAYIKGEEIINIQMDIAHSGDFGFHAKLDYMLGAQYAGKYANLFYIVEPGKYDFIQSCRIDANGMATFILNHASSYIVVIRDEEYVGEPIVQATPAPTPQPTPEPTVAPTAEPAKDVQENNADKDGKDISVTDKKDSEPSNGKNEAVTTIGAAENAGNNIFAIVGVIVVVAAIGGGVAVYFVKRKK